MGKDSGRFEILPDQMALAHHVAEWMTLAALAAKGPFRVSLSGGSTPKTLYQLLASDEFSSRFPWPRVFWYWGDERFVPYDHPDSNYRMVREAMLTIDPRREERGPCIPGAVGRRAHLVRRPSRGHRRMNARLSLRVGSRWRVSVPSRWQGRGGHELYFAKQAPLAPRGRGEPGQVRCAAIANVYRATGTRSRDLPITVDKLL